MHSSQIIIQNVNPKIPSILAQCVAHILPVNLGKMVTLVNIPQKVTSAFKCPIDSSENCKMYPVRPNETLP